ncbi:MAG: hypothetical protein ACFFB3_07635 [Candidatus Hodarchaeota archaeon]
MTSIMKTMAAESITSQDNPENYFPSILKPLTNVTIVLAAIGLLIGLLLLAITWNLPLEEETQPEEEDPLPNFDYFFRFLGIVFTVFALIGLGGSFLVYKKKILGWFSLVGVYLSGFLGCFYIFSRFFIMTLENNSNLLLLGLLRSPIPYLMIWSGYALLILFHKNTISYVFRN